MHAIRAELVFEPNLRFGLNFVVGLSDGVVSYHLPSFKRCVVNATHPLFLTCRLGFLEMLLVLSFRFFYLLNLC